ncbi:MAG: REP-associated tyrosine transposase [Formosimonas sp.]
MMSFPVRRSIRLAHYDYTQEGLYFVTICVHNRRCLLGEVRDGVMWVNELGEQVRKVWQDLPLHYPHVALHEFVIMPNHIHGVIELNDRTTHGLSEIVRALKTFSARRINQMLGLTSAPFWQRNYHEHVIRDERSCNQIFEYIQNNPAQWAQDRYFVHGRV